MILPSKKWIEILTEFFFRFTDANIEELFNTVKGKPLTQLAVNLRE